MRVGGAMDANRSRIDTFDDLATALASESSRRGFLRLLGGSALAAGLAACGVQLASPQDRPPLFVCTPACGPCQQCLHAFFESPTCVTTCGACGFCDADSQTCVSSCSACEECKAGVCQSTCPSCQACDNGTCRDCGQGPCEQCVDGRCRGCDPACERCDSLSGTCTTKCPGGATCCGGSCASCCGPCDHTTGTCRDALSSGDICTAEGAICCGERCKDVQNDPENCGNCDHRCTLGDRCCKGACTDTRDDPKNCGGCGLECDAGFVCCRSQCVSAEIAAEEGLDCCPNERRCTDQCCPKGQRCNKEKNRCECPPLRFECTNAEGDSICCGEGERCCDGRCIPVDRDCCPLGQHPAGECRCCPDGQECRDGQCKPIDCPTVERTCFSPGPDGFPIGCCPAGQLCDEQDQKCKTPCVGSAGYLQICDSDSYCCETMGGCIQQGYACCAEGESWSGADPPCCPDTTQHCCGECRPFAQGCFC